jgi:hypothetical protein
MRDDGTRTTLYFIDRLHVAGDNHIRVLRRNV